MMIDSRYDNLSYYGSEDLQLLREESSAGRVDFIPQSIEAILMIKNTWNL